MTGGKAGKLKRLILPGLVFQSLVVAGGYGTGAELSQFFFKYGPVGGLLGMAVVTFVIWAAVCVVTFEFARVFSTYNYKAFFQKLLGRGWFLFEICYFISMLLVLAVLAATAGLSFQTIFNAPIWVGTVIVCLCITGLVLGGTEAVEKFLALWSYLLYAVYIVFLILCFLRFGDRIGYHLFLNPQIEPGWYMGGAEYAFYNLGIIPAVLFSVRHVSTRKEAVQSGILAAAIGIFPAIMLFVAMTGLYPHITSAETPVSEIFSILQIPALQYLFQVVLFGSLIDSGAGMIKAVSDRFESSYILQRKATPLWLRPAVTISCLCSGMLISAMGLTWVIEKGYGTITWGFFLIYILPVLTVGIYMLWKKAAKLSQGNIVNFVRKGR